MLHGNPLLMPSPLGDLSAVIHDKVFGPRPNGPGLVGTPGTYGDSSRYPVITTDSQGRVTGVTTQAVPTGSVGSSNLTADAILAVRDFAPPLVGIRGVSVANANGISGTVLLASLYPIITLTLGNITPASVAATGTVTGSNLSGTNTGDQNLAPYMQKANNLSDVASASTARTNLGLGSLATQSGTFSGTSSGTNTGDQNLAPYMQGANNLSDVASASSARSNLGLGSLATQSGTFSGTSSGVNTGDQTIFDGGSA